MELPEESEGFFLSVPVEFRCLQTGSASEQSLRGQSRRLQLMKFFDLNFEVEFDQRKRQEESRGSTGG